MLYLIVCKKISYKTSCFIKGLPNENIIGNYTQKLEKENNKNKFSLNKVNKNLNTLLNYFKIEENNNSCIEMDID